MMERKISSYSFAILASMPGVALAARDDVENLRQQLEPQQTLIKAQQQQQQLKQLAEILEGMSHKIENLAASQPADNVATPARKSKVVPPSQSRDNVGDLNREGVTAGDFPGGLDFREARISPWL